MKYFALFLVLFLLQLGHSQEVYYKSSIITLNNDTIKGFASNVYDAKNILFRKTKNSEPKLYTPGQLNGVILDDNIFESRAINVPTYKNISLVGADMSGHLTRDKKERIVDTLFLQKLVNGKINFLKFTRQDGFVYYFIEKNKKLIELPPIYYSRDSGEITYELLKTDASISESSAIVRHNDYLNTLANVLGDKSFFDTNRKFTYSENSIIGYISQYNKKNGATSNGILKNKMSRKIFMGVDAGFLSLLYDPVISDAKITSTAAINVYGLFPLMGINRSFFGKFGFNYYTYHNDVYEKTIPSASFGLRYATVSGRIRPYFESSIGVSFLTKNNRPTNLGFPLFLEIGALAPVKDKYLTFGITLTPVMLSHFNGYNLLAYHVGVMF